MNDTPKEIEDFDGPSLEDIRIITIENRFNGCSEYFMEHEGATYCEKHMVELGYPAGPVLHQSDCPDQYLGCDACDRDFIAFNQACGWPQLLKHAKLSDLVDRGKCKVFTKVDMVESFSTCFNWERIVLPSKSMWFYEYIQCHRDELYYEVCSREVATYLGEDLHEHVTRRKMVRQPMFKSGYQWVVTNHRYVIDEDNNRIKEV